MEKYQISIGGRTLVNPEEVLMLKADINYTVVHFINGKSCIVATPLKSLEARFEGHNFFRSHKSFLVNLGFVKHYFRTKNQLQMMDNQLATVSRRKTIGLYKCLSFKQFQ